MTLVILTEDVVFPQVFLINAEEVKQVHKFFMQCIFTHNGDYTHHSKQRFRSGEAGTE